MPKESPSQIQYRKWHEDIEIIRPQSHKLDNYKRAYSEDFELLATEIAKEAVNAENIQLAIQNMKICKRDLPSNDFKTHVGHFIVASQSVYADPSPAREYLLNKGWLLQPVSTSASTDKSYREKQTEDSGYYSIFDRINDAFETFRFRLDDMLDYIIQFVDDGKFKTISILLILAGIITTFWTGHWGWGIAEIVAILIIWGQADVGEISDIVGGLIGKILATFIWLLKVVFYKWWSLLLIIALAIGIPYGYSYYESRRIKKNYEIQLHNARVCVAKERYMDACGYLEKAIAFNTAEKDSLVTERNKLLKKADNKAQQLKKNIKQELASVQKERKSPQLIEAIRQIQQDINLLHSNEKNAADADLLQKQLDEVKRKKGIEN